MTGNPEVCSVRIALMVTCMALAASLVACAGEGVSYERIEEPVTLSCAPCHSVERLPQLLDDIRAADDAAFTAEAFPDSHFPEGLRLKTVESLRTTADPASDADIDPNAALRKAWILHELHELEALIMEATPPDFTSQDRFDAFALLGAAGAYEGCELAEKLDLGHGGDPEGMPPLWARKLFELLGQPLEGLETDSRQLIRDYVDGLLPGGVGACQGGEGSAS